MSVERVAISLEPELLRKLQASMGRRLHYNRSKAIADVLHEWLSKEEWARGNGERIGTISLVYAHHAHGVLDRITRIQHDSGASIISTMHVHISHEECLETIAVRGRAKTIQEIADRISSVRGVASCRLSIMK